MVSCRKERSGWVKRWGCRGLPGRGQQLSQARQKLGSFTETSKADKYAGKRKAETSLPVPP